MYQKRDYGMVWFCLMHKNYFICPENVTVLYGVKNVSFSFLLVSLKTDLFFLFELLFFFLENLICWGTRSVLISSDIYSPFASLFFCAS